MKSFYRKQGKKGFTLAEVLLTVAIIVILMAIAVPAIFTIRKNLRQKALDNKAEIIYTAVQNNLTKLKSNGNSAKFAADKATRVEPSPMDADGEKTLYYVTAEQKDVTGNAASVIVTADTVDAELYGHYWVVEYDPESASVYAVFYSETKADYTPATYNHLRYKKNRLKDGAKVGYYGGDSVDGSNTSALVPKITVKNEEKLQVIINSKRPDDNPLSFDVKLTDTEGHTLTLKYGTDNSGKSFVHKKDDTHQADASHLDTGNESGTIRGNNYTLTLTLDALKDLDGKENAGSRFDQLYGKATTNDWLKTQTDHQLIAGTRLTIEVTVHSDSSMIDGLSATAATNSLFGDDSTVDQAEILYGRHLQNLDQNSGVTATVTKAVQKSDIHFEQEEEVEDGQIDTTSWYSCYSDLAFHPITNNQLISYEAQADRTTDGAQAQAGLLISHLTTEESEKAGLFAETANNMIITGVRLESARIRGQKAAGGDTYAGALAGYARGKITVTNCQSYLAAEDLEGKTEKDSWIDGASIQGGLIGSAAGKVIMTGSLSATVMGDEENTRLAGGLIGQTQKGADLQTSYADSYVTGETTGGLVADASNATTIRLCYAAGYQKAVKMAGGFLARTGATTDISNSYTAVTWLTADTEDPNDRAVYYSVIPFNKTNGSEDPTRNTYFLNEGTDYSADQKENRSVGIKVSYTQLSNVTKMAQNLNGTTTTGTRFGSASSTTPYNLKNQGLTSYSYPALVGLPHYGDWQASFEAGSLVYYEVYKEGTTATGTTNYSYGFYGGNIEPSLQEDKTIAGDGYGVVYSKGEIPKSEFTIIYQELTKTGETESRTYKIDPKNKDTLSYTVKAGKETYVIYPLPVEMTNTAPQKDTYYQKLVIRGADAVGTDKSDDSDEDNATGSIFYYNPHVAKSVITTGEDIQKLETPKTILIRTARQLYALSNYYAEYAKTTKDSTFVQELDIDYAAYEWTKYANVENEVTVQKPIGETQAFVAKYDGRYHKIQNISFASEKTEIGFIGENAGIIQNLFLVSDYQAGAANPYLAYEKAKEIGSKTTVYMGALVGVNNGQIHNCAVSGYYVGGTAHTVYVGRNGTFYFGGLAGKNVGTIRNSQVDTPLINANVLYGKAYIGGLVGENASTGKIIGSYAIGKETVEYSKGETSVLSGFAGKNAGYLNDDYCAVTMTAAGSTETYGFAKRGGSITNCTYLSGGTFRYLGKMEAFDNTSGAGTAENYGDMKQTQTTAAECSSATSSQEGYPFKAVVRKDAQGNKVHFGNWQMDSDLGSYGVIYWEKEEKGSNNGYHFAYIGYTADEEDPEHTVRHVSGSTLCQEHDDGGIITKYGYAYYYSDDLQGADIPTIVVAGFEMGENPYEESGKVKNPTSKAENKKASEELSARLDGFKVVAFTTASAIATSAKDTDGYMKMKGSNVNGVWTITDNRHNGVKYDFTINPFFANAMQYGTQDGGESAASSLTVLGEDGRKVTENDRLAMPGADGQQYEIRSADQLQYLNWNSNTGDAVTTLEQSNYRTVVNYYTYLGQVLGKGAGTGTATGTGTGTSTAATAGKFSFIQTHDVDADMTPKGDITFTQIGSLYDTKGDRVSTSTSTAGANEANAFVVFFTGSYNGNAYSIKNIEVNSTNTVTGLFGSIIGARVSNIVLYSDKGNYIRRSKKSPRSWYALGGMCGLAAMGTGNTAADTMIENCTVSGYTIQDNSTQGAFGDGCVGGMFGMSTLDLKQCTAVNTIELNEVFDNVKWDGTAVRVGGLVGSMRGTVSLCYTGGRITVTEPCLNNTKQSYGGKLFLGGLTGGIYIKEGNLTQLMGDNIQGYTGWSNETNDTGWGFNGREWVHGENYGICQKPTTVIENCYTYIQMPNTKRELDCIRSIEPIGSNGETPHERDLNRHVRIQLNNCYYYDINTYKHFTCNSVYGGYVQERDHTNIEGTAIGLKWDDLKEKLFNGLSGVGFQPVTTTEANGHTVSGKYSFPGNSTSLDGKDYPFPTILQQQANDGSIVNVHYGEWPQDGIYWEDSRTEMDIFENLDLENGAENAVAYKTFILKDDGNKLGKKNNFEFLYGEISDETAKVTSGEEDADGMQADASNIQILSNEDRIAEVTKIEYDSKVGGYIATVAAYKTGTEVITATINAGTATDPKEYRASFTLTVTADLTAYADSETVSLGNGDKVELAVHAVPMSMYQNGSDEDITTETQSKASDTGIVTEEQTLDLQNEAVQTEADAQMILAQNGEAIAGVDSTTGSESSDTDTATGEAAEDSTGNDAEEMTDGEIQMQMAQEDESEYAESVLTPYADLTEEALTPQRDLAPYMSWTIDGVDTDFISVTDIKASSDNQMRFTITGLADLEQDMTITLTITGTYTYMGEEYKTTTWVEVTKKETATQMMDENGNIYNTDDTVIDGSTSEDQSDETGDITEDGGSSAEDTDITTDQEAAEDQEAASGDSQDEIIMDSGSEEIMQESASEESAAESLNESSNPESNAVIGIE